MLASHILMELSTPHMSTVMLRMMEMLTNTQGRLHAAGVGHEDVVLEKASKQRLTHGF